MLSSLRGLPDGLSQLKRKFVQRQDGLGPLEQLEEQLRVYKNEVKICKDNLSILEGEVCTSTSAVFLTALFLFHLLF